MFAKKPKKLLTQQDILNLKAQLAHNRLHMFCELPADHFVGKPKHTVIQEQAKKLGLAVDDSLREVTKHGARILR